MTLQLGRKTSRSHEAPVTAITFHSGSYFASLLNIHKLNLEGLSKSPQKGFHCSGAGLPCTKRRETLPPSGLFRSSQAGYLPFLEIKLERAVRPTQPFPFFFALKFKKKFIFIEIYSQDLGDISAD